jgi:hypothetical protein
VDMPIQGLKGEGINGIILTINKSFLIHQILHSLSVCTHALYADRMYTINGLNLGLRSVRAHISPSLSRQSRSLHVSELYTHFHLCSMQTMAIILTTTNSMTAATG